MNMGHPIASEILKSGLFSPADCPVKPCSSRNSLLGLPDQRGHIKCWIRGRSRPRPVVERHMELLTGKSLDVTRLLGFDARPELFGVKVERFAGPPRFSHYLFERRGWNRFRQHSEHQSISVSQEPVDLGGLRCSRALDRCWWLYAGLVSEAYECTSRHDGIHHKPLFIVGECSGSHVPPCFGGCLPGRVRHRHRRTCDLPVSGVAGWLAVVSRGLRGEFESTVASLAHNQDKHCTYVGGCIGM